MREITSIHQLLGILNEDNNKSYSFFRGHSNINFVIKPSIGRKTEKFSDWLFEIKEINQNLNSKQKESVGLQQYEWMALSEFKAKKIPYHNEKLNYFELMILAQHQGLRTRLLDVSMNPLVALFFATNDEDKDGELIMFNSSWAKKPIIKSGINDSRIELLGDNIFDFLMFVRHLDDYTFVIPNHLSPRIIAQDSCFIMFKQPLKEIEKKEGIDVLLIPKNSKSKLQRELKKLGITKSRLFPELNSIAEEIDKNWF